MLEHMISIQSVDVLALVRLFHIRFKIQLEERKKTTRKFFEVYLMWRATINEGVSVARDGLTVRLDG